MACTVRGCTAIILSREIAKAKNKKEDGYGLQPPPSFSPSFRLHQA